MFCFAKTIFKRLIILILLVFLPGYGIFAQDVETYHQQAEKLVQKMELSKEQLQKLFNQETTVLGLIENMDRRLEALKKQALVFSSQLEHLNDDLKKNQERCRRLEIKIESLRMYAKKRLAAVYKMNRMGTFSMMASADSFSEFLFCKNALERILAQDEKVIAALIQDQAEYEQLTAEIAIQKQKKLELEADFKKEIGLAEEEKEKRRRILAEIRNQKSLHYELLEAYRQAAVFLENTISRLGKEKEDQKIRTFVPRQSFDTFKGLLNMPVSGKITTQFGPYKDEMLNVDCFNNGITVQTDRGEPIHAVQEGLVLFAGWLKGYGKVIIIDHGYHYYTVYAHAEELFKNKGDPVESGEVIATVGDSGSVSGPELYFEVRYHGKPVDPLEWIKKG